MDVPPSAQNLGWQHPMMLFNNYGPSNVGCGIGVLYLGKVKRVQGGLKGEGEN